jgi:hypothetical protein
MNVIYNEQPMDVEKPELCEYSNCRNELDNEWQPKKGMKLCKHHADKFARLAKAYDVAGLMKFFAEACVREEEVLVGTYTDQLGNEQEIWH